MTKKAPSLKCPRCEQVDAAYKVSALYEHGFSTETYQRVIPPPPKTNWAPLIKTEERTIQSNLSKKLSPPPKPKINGIYKITIVLTVLVGWGAQCMTIGTADAERFAMLIVIVLIGGGLATFQKKSEETRVANLMPDWTKAMERWNQLYYCARDDIIFNPDDGAFVSANKMNQYLYR